MTKICISCGMPMEKPEDFSQGDVDRDYCVNCTRPDGSMLSYEETLDGYTKFIVKTQGLDEEAARRSAIDIMAGLPAWKDRS